MIVSGQSYQTPKSPGLAGKVPVFELEEPLFCPSVVGPRDGYSSGTHVAATILGGSTVNAAVDDYTKKLFGTSTPPVSVQSLDINSDGPCLNGSRAGQTVTRPDFTTDSEGFLLTV